MVAFIAQTGRVTVYIQDQNNFKENFGYVTKNNAYHCLSVLAQYNANKQN